MATEAMQTNCDRCKRPLVGGASYCDHCGARTRRAKRMVTQVLRIELIALAAMIALTVIFSVTLLRQ